MKNSIKWMGLAVVIIAISGGFFYASQEQKPTDKNQGAIETMNQNNGQEPIATTHITEMNMVNLLDVSSKMATDIMENVTTGYQWVIEVSGDTDAIRYTFDDKAVAQETTTARETTATDSTAIEPMVCGAGVMKTLQVEGVKAGFATLTMKLVRPWEKDMAPLEVLVYNFSVK